MKTVVIAGPPSEFVTALTYRFARSGCTVVAAKQINLGEAGALERFVAQTARAHGNLDAWINCLQVARIAPAESLTSQDWVDGVNTVLSTTFSCCQVAGRQMLKQGQGVILNVASIFGVSFESGYAAYSTAQAGVIALTSALGVEWGSRGVRVAGIAIADPAADATENGGATFARRTPIRRLPTLDEIAEAVFYLASDEASFITAETLRVDGGWLAYQLF